MKLATTILILLVSLGINECFGQTTSTDSVFYDVGYRKHIIHLPPSYSPQKQYPLVFVLHGGGGSATFMMNYSLFNATSDANDFIVVYPEGEQTGFTPAGLTAHHWADGRLASPPDTEGVDDVSYIRNLIDTLSQEYSIDQAKIFSAGISNGGFMSQKLACQLSDRILAVATVAATFPDSLVSKCTPSLPVSTMFINGTNDIFVPTFTGGMLPFGFGGWVLSTESAISNWRKLNACTSEVDSTDVPNTVLFDFSTVRKYVWSDCSDSSEIVLFKVFGGGHTWPQENEDLHVPLTGVVNQDLNTNQEIWDFFSSHCRTTVSISETNIEKSSPKIFPNPNHGVFQIDLQKTYLEVDVSIVNTMGQVVYQEQCFHKSSVSIGFVERSGLYFVNLRLDGKTEVLALVKN